MLHGSGMLGSKMPASKPHLYSCYIILQCSWLECAKAAWPNLQPVSQTQCLQPSASIQPAAFSLGSTKNGWGWAAEPFLPHRLTGLWALLAASEGADGKRLLFLGEGGNNLWLPVGWEAYLRREEVGVLGCCCPAVVGKAAACVGRVKTGRCR